MTVFDAWPPPCAACSAADPAEENTSKREPCDYISTLGLFKRFDDFMIMHLRELKMGKVAETIH